MKKKNLTSKAIEGCDDNLSAVSAFSLYEISQLISCGVGFIRLAITKWLANVTGATGILQRHKEHIDDSF